MKRGLLRVGGRLGLVAAVAIGYAIIGLIAWYPWRDAPVEAPIWPLAGLGILAALRWGMRGISGVFWGAAALHGVVGWHAGLLSADAFDSAAWIWLVGVALGCAGQAAVGRSLISRRVGPPDAVVGARDVFATLWWGGPVASALGAAMVCGVAAVVPHLQTSPWALALAWVVNDSLAVATMVPLGLAWWDRPSPFARSRRWGVIVPVAVAIGVTGVATHGVARLERQHEAWVAHALVATHVSAEVVSPRLWPQIPGLLPGVVAVSGLSLTAMLAAFLWVLSGRERGIRRLVARRTEELARKNSDLVDEIARRREVEALLREAKEAAEAAASAKGAFLANISHEVRTPLHGIIGSSELLDDTVLDPDQRRWNQAVRDSAEALLTLLDDVLRLSKLESGRVELEARDVDVVPFIESVTEAFSAVATRKGLLLAPRIAADTPAVVRGDATRLRQVLSNLLANAVKFTERGHVVLSVRPGSSRNELRFEVADSGIGIDEEAQARIFEPFTQADGSTSRRFGGTGLGLAIARRLVGAMGGEMGVRSAVAEGSAFWFTGQLPAVGADTVARRIPTSFRGVRAAVAFQSGVLGSLVCRLLDQAGLSVREASGAGDLLVLLEQHASGRARVDVAVLDGRDPDIARTLGLVEAAGLVGPAVVVVGGDRPRAAVGYVPVPWRRSWWWEALERARSGEALVPPSDADRVDRAAPRILVADDNPVNQMVVARLLTALGYQTQVVASGREVVDAAATGPWDLVLMDCQMPDIDGFEATRRIRALGSSASRVPIVALTANTMDGDRERCMEAGMDDFLSKPLRRESLEAVVSRWEGRPSERPVES